MELPLPELLLPACFSRADALPLAAHSCSPADHSEPEAGTELQKKKKRRKRKPEPPQGEESKHPEGQRSPRPSVTPVPGLSVNGHLPSDRLGKILPIAAEVVTYCSSLWATRSTGHRFPSAANKYVGNQSF